MTDKKLTDNEIIKGLRSWLEEIRKARQAYLEKVNEVHYPSMRYEYLLSDTIHEITRLQVENENYSKNNQQMTSDILNLYKALEEAKAENKKLKDFATSKCQDCAGCTSWKCDCANIKAEAYKEVLQKVHIARNQSLINKTAANKIEKILKELVGEDK